MTELQENFLSQWHPNYNCNEIAWIDDIYKILDGEAEDGDAASTGEYANLTEEELYRELNRLTLEVLGEAIDNYQHYAEAAEEKAMRSVDPSNRHAYNFEKGSNAADILDFIIHNQIATWDEINLVLSINGQSEESLNNIIQVRTGYHNIQQCVLYSPDKYSFQKLPILTENK